VIFFSRAVVGHAEFKQQPTAADVCRVLGPAAKRGGRAPKYTVTDQGAQFRQGFRDWCVLHGVKPRFGAVGERGSIAVLERFMLSLKDECTRRIVVPYAVAAMRAEIARFVRWHAEFRPHQGLGGCTPLEVYESRLPACRGPRFEPRARYPAANDQDPIAPLRARRGAKLELVVSDQDTRLRSGNSFQQFFETGSNRRNGVWQHPNQWHGDVLELPTHRPEAVSGVGTVCAQEYHTRQKFGN
jgi:hypothetical protein